MCNLQTCRNWNWVIAEEIAIYLHKTKKSYSLSNLSHSIIKTNVALHVLNYCFCVTRSSMKSGRWIVLESAQILKTELQVYKFLIFAWIFFLKMYICLNFWMYSAVVLYTLSKVRIKKCNFVTDMYLHGAPDGGSKNKINEKPSYLRP